MTKSLKKKLGTLFFRKKGEDDVATNGSCNLNFSKK
jgi:hypothetical protein